MRIQFDKKKNIKNKTLKDEIEKQINQMRYN